MDTEAWPDEEELTELPYDDLIAHGEDVREAAQRFMDKHEETEDVDDLFAGLACKLRVEEVRDILKRRKRTRSGPTEAFDDTSSGHLDVDGDVPLDDIR